MPGLRDWSIRAYWACQERIAPDLRYSQLHYEDALRDNIRAGVDWLDIGCGKRLLPEWRHEAEAELAARARSLTGIDPHEPSLRANRTISAKVLGFADRLPFREATFDVVTANMVVEHLAEPRILMREVCRVLRPGGRFVFHTPNRDGYTTRLARLVPETLKKGLIRMLEGRHASDVFPTHYRANTRKEIIDLAAATGFEVESVSFTLSAAQFAVILPLAVLELLWIRLLMNPRLAHLRHTLIVVLRKPFSSA
jgi:SAM-dependent methyltransferase